MLEKSVNIFDYFGEVDAICITTNGFTKKDGRAVMGAGVAKSIRDYFKNIDMVLGETIKHKGNHVYKLIDYKNTDLLAFPVKHNWWENGDIELIKRSCHELMQYINDNQLTKVLLPRPGCGNGKLDWNEVKKEIEILLDDRVTVVNI